MCLLRYARGIRRATGRVFIKRTHTCSVYSVQSTERNGISPWDVESFHLLIVWAVLAKESREKLGGG